MNIPKVFSAVGFCLILFGGSAIADRTESVSEVVPAEGAQRLEVNIDFGAGQLDIVPADMEEAAKLDIDYTPRWVRYNVDYSKEGDAGILSLESELRRKRDMDDVDNEWKLTLSRRYPMELDMNIGASESYIDLGGIPLTNVTMDVGATSGTIDFSEKNPERLKDFKVEVGASSLDMTGLANANFERMDFSSGAASSELDFRGDFHGEAELSVDVGVGSVKIILPKGLPIRIEGDDSWFSSLDLHGLDVDRVEDDVWESPEFEQAKDRLTIMVDVSMGSVDIYAKR